MSVLPTSDAAVLAELGRRLSAARVAADLTQADLAARAGVSKRTVERLESGEVAAQLSAFIRVLRVLNLLERFEALVPEPQPSPIAQLQLAGKTRRRASRRAKAATPGTGWTWGSET